MERAGLLCPALLCALVVTGCATTSGDDLYRNLGGDAGVTVLADEFTYRVSSDARVAEFWAGSDLDRFAGLMREHFCEVSGGPCTYSGVSMEEAHRGMGVTLGDFNAVVEILVDAMESLGVPQQAQNELLARLAPMHEDILEP